MTDRYAVIGNPVEHSRSPEIHVAFAAQTAQDIEYVRLLAPLDGFGATVEAFRAKGGRGANVTLPFKEEAFRLATSYSARAQVAGAVNTLRFDDGLVYGDNTDGLGLVRDIRDNLGVVLAGKRILLVGAGGAARGVLGPLLEERPAALVIANRTEARARSLTGLFSGIPRVSAFEELSGERFDVVVNATSASLAGSAPPLPPGIFAADSLAYELMYGKGDTPFMARARAEGARVADGLGMLVEQAAESFLIWRGVRPLTHAVLESMRKGLP